MALRIIPIDPPPLRQREPRKHDRGHLDAIRALPCLCCGARPRSEAAHLRAGSMRHHKNPTGLGQKPDDRWTLPLCPRCHRVGVDSQHSRAEMAFWKALGVKPHDMAVALYEAEAHKERLVIVLDSLLDRQRITPRERTEMLHG